MKNNHIQELENLFEKRFGFVKQVWELKRLYWKPSFDQEQWNRVKEQVKKQATKHTVSDAHLDIIWNEIHDVSLKIEDIILEVPKEEKRSSEEYYNFYITPLRDEIQALNAPILEKIAWILEGKNNVQDRMDTILNSIHKAGESITKARTETSV